MSTSDTVLMTITVDSVDEAPVFTVDGQDVPLAMRRTEPSADVVHLHLCGIRP